MPRPPRLLTLAAVVAALILGLLTIPHPGAAQQPQATISGTVRLATPDATLPEGVQLQLIILDQSQDPTSISQRADGICTAPGGCAACSVDPLPFSQLYQSVTK